MGYLSEDGQFFIPVIEGATLRSMIDVVTASNALCIVCPEYCAEQLKTGQLPKLPFHPPWLHVAMGIMYRRNRPLSATELVFWNVARSVERKYFRHRKS